jgi:peptidoglycan hydrolase-like protein with peptidoglycan-binding domain
LDDVTLAALLRRRLVRWIVVPMRRHPVDSLGVAVMLALVLMTLINALFLQSGKHPAPMRAIAAISQVSGETTGSTTESTTGSLVTMPRPRPAEISAVSPAPATPAEPAARAASDVITEIQKELARKGFYDGAVDGRHGPRMEAAIQHFAQAAGLKTAMPPDENLLAVVVQSRVKAKADARKPPPHGPRHADPAPAPAASPAPAAARVVAVQRALAEFGYGQIKTTGVFDPATKAAVEKFERERRLPVTGKLSDRLMKELASVTGRPLE